MFRITNLFQQGFFSVQRGSPAKDLFYHFVSANGYLKVSKLVLDGYWMGFGWVLMVIQLSYPSETILKQLSYILLDVWMW